MDWDFVPQLPTIDLLPRLLAVGLVMGGLLGWWIGQTLRPAAGVLAGVVVVVTVVFFGAITGLIIGGAAVAIGKRFYEQPKLGVEHDPAQRASRSARLKATDERLKRAFDEAVTRRLRDEES